MRVLHLAGYRGPYAGSFVAMLRAAASAVRERGGETQVGLVAEVADRPWLADLAADGIAVRFAPDGRRERAAWLEAWVAETRAPTVLHTHFTDFDMDAAALARRGRAAAIWHIHSRLSSRRAVVARNVVRFALVGRSVHAVLCVAPDIAQGVRRRGAPARKVRFFPNAIDTERFLPPTAARRAEARAQLGLGDAERVVLHFGWDWERKGGDLFMQAMRDLSDRGGAGVTGLCAGGGAPGIELCRALSLERVVKVLEPTNDVQRLYHASDVFVTCSRAEGMPFAMAEALSSGLPVVASDIPGQAWMGRSLPGCVLAPLEPAALADGILRLLSRDPARAAREGDAGREWVRAEMGLPQWGERLADVYADSLSASGL